MLQAMLNILDIHSNERKLVLPSLLLAFIMGVVQCYLLAAPMSLFLTYFTSSLLPQVYLWVAILSVIVGMVYGAFENYYSFEYRILKLIFMIGSITAGLWLLLASVEHVVVIAILTVWAIVAYDLLGLGLWSVFNRMYQLHQAKRLFGIIGASQSIGGVLSGLLLPFLLLFTSIKIIIFITGCLIFLAWIILKKFLNRPETLPVHASEEIQNNAPVSMRNLLKDPYILKLMGLIILGAFAQVITDVLFNTIAEMHYASKASLAGFLGVFFGLVDGFILLVNIFFLKWFLKRYGLIWGTLLLPILMVVISALLLIAYQRHIGILIFYLVVILKLVESGLRTSLTRMSHLMLLQPLMPNLRSYVLSKNEIFIMPLASIIISVVLMVITGLFGVVLPWFSIGIFVCFGCILGVGLWLKKDYIQALSHAMANRYFTSSPFQYFNKENLPIFRQALRSRYPDEIIYALTMIEQIDKQEFLKELKLAFKSHNTTVKLFLLQKIKQYHLTSLYDEILMMFDEETDSHIKAQIMRTLAHLDYTKARDKLWQLAYNFDSDIYETAFVLLWQYDHDSIEKEMLERIKYMSKSHDAAQRRTAAWMIGEIHASDVTPLLGQLLADREKIVYYEACYAVIKVQAMRYFEHLLQHLEGLSIQEPLLPKFLALLESQLPRIASQFMHYSEPIKIKLLHFISHIKHPAAQAFLKEKAFEKNEFVKGMALSLLAHAQTVLSSDFKKRLDQQLKHEIRFIEKQHDDLNRIPHVPMTQLLRNALWRRIALGIERILYLIQIYYGQTILAMKTSIESNNLSKISYTLELLANILNTEHKNILLPILNKIYLIENQPPIHLASDEWHDVIKKQLQREEIDAGSALTVLACLGALYIIKTIGSQSFTQELQRLRRSPLLIIQETLSWVENEIPGQGLTYIDS